MAYTYIPEFAIIIVFFLGSLLTFAYMVYTIHSIYKNFDGVKKLNVSDKIFLFTLLIYSILLLGVLVVHMSMSGLYHDSHATGPSDIEHNFNFVNMVLILITLGLSNIVLNKNLQN
jgi:hypothetical protein